MTRLRLIREPSAGGATLGALYVNGVWRCWTLEDPIRERPGEPVEAWKRPGDTAIPAGRYAVKTTYSPKFDRMLPEVLSVPGFSGIRIHAGNRAIDTEGCVLVGFVRANAVIQQSRPAVEVVIEACVDGAELTIENPV